MKKIFVVWLINITIIFIWIYFLFISPKVFNNKYILVPDIVDMNINDGIQVLKNEHIKHKLIYVESENISILKTNPEHGIRIKPNYEVEVYVGIEPVRLYKGFLGKNYNDIEDEIISFSKDNNIKLKLNYINDDNSVDGTIINESLINGEKLDNIEELTLTIVNNKSLVVIPNFVGMHINEVLEFVNINKLNVNFIYLETPVLPDIILSQSVKPSTLIVKNNNYKIDIYVSKAII